MTVYYMRFPGHFSHIGFLCYLAWKHSKKICCFILRCSGPNSPNVSPSEHIVCNTKLYFQIEGSAFVRRPFVVVLTSRPRLPYTYVLLLGFLGLVVYIVGCHHAKLQPATRSQGQTLCTLTFWKVAGLCNKVSLISHRDVVIAAPTIPFDVLLVTQGGTFAINRPAPNYNIAMAKHPEPPQRTKN